MADDSWQVLWDEITETFSPGSPIEERDLFAGRIKELAKLVDAVQQRGRHAIVYGERGVGKTSLVNILSLVYRAEFKDTIYVRVNAVPSATFSSLWKNVFKRLSYQLGDGTTKRIADEYTQGMTPDDVQLELESFSNKSAIIVLDEFDRIDNKEVTTLVADTIKALSDYSINVTVIVSGVAEDVTGLITGHESISRSLVQVKMPRMSQDELGEIVMKRYKKLGLDITGDGIWKIAFLARGLPFYAHLLGMHAARIANTAHRRKISDADVDEALDASLTEIDQLLKERYYAAIISKRGDALYDSVLLACALAHTDELGRFQQAAVAAPLNKIFPDKNYAATTYAFHMNAMCTAERQHVLERLGDEKNFRYRFTDPMMQPFVILRGLADKKINDDIAQIYANRRQLRLSI
jgi:hypothetical protein